MRHGRVCAVLLLAVAAAGFATTAGAGSDRKPPSTPSRLTVTGATSGSLVLSWWRSTDRGSGVAGYRLYLEGSNVGVTTQTWYTFTQLSCGRSYTLGVQSYDRAGNRSALARIVASTAPCPDTTPPTAPSGLAQTASSQTSVSLAWVASYDNFAVSAYNVYRDGSVVGRTQGTSYTFSGLVCGRSYTVGVEAVDAAGNASPRTFVLAGTSPCPDTLAPAAPTFLVQTSATTSTIAVSWAASIDNFGVVGYGVYVNGVRVSTTTLTSSSVVNLSCGKTYTLGVDAFDAAGNRSPQASVTAATSTCPTTTPPGGTVTFTAVADARVEEANPSSNFGSSFLRDDGGTDPDVHSYLRFAVRGLSGAVTSAKLRMYATSSTVDGPALYATATDWSENAVTWGNRPAPASPASDDKGSISSGTWIEFDVTRLVTGDGVYGFVLIGTSSDGVDMSSREGSAAPQLVLSTGTVTRDTSAPTAPRGLTATGVTATGVALAWLPSTDDVGVAGYNVFVDGVRSASTSSTAYNVLSLACGRAYTFGVEAKDAAGNLSLRATLSTATAACPTPSVACDKYAAPTGSDSASGTLAAPYRTAQKLGSSLGAGMTGCLRAGTYSVSSGYVLDLSTGGYRIRSYPGERAKLVGIVHVRSSASGVILSHLAFEGTGGQNTIKIYAADVVVENSDITNAWRGLSCMILGSNSGYGQALRVIVRRNRFHECGDPANGNQDHAIYAQNVLAGEISGNVFWNTSGYTIQLYPNAQRTRFVHNVVDGDAPSVRGGVLFGGDTSYASKDNVVEYNVITYAATYNITSTWSGAVGSGNVARNNCLWAGERKLNQRPPIRRTIEPRLSPRVDEPLPQRRQLRRRIAPRVAHVRQAPRP
jgi:chitodextrinase